MNQKGNLIENWEKAYQDFNVTYTEKIENPIDLSEKCSRELLLEDIRKYLPDCPKAKILECGCGGARNSLYLALRGFDVACSDFSPEAFRLAKANFSAFGAQGAFLVDDLMHSNIPDNSFDCVMSFGLLEHFESLRPLADNLTRMVKPGGIQIHLVIPKKFSTQTISQVIWFPYQFLHYAVKKHDFHNIIKKSWRDFPHYESRLGPEDYKKAFRAAGNEMIRCEPRDSLLPLVYLPLRIGNIMVKYFPGTLMDLFRRANRTESRLMYFISTAFCLICRKK
jgi:2-polyprenyl-3-methyl-5-hydroxy-6-metoxy-1,4-benzoquinol methylase